MYKFRSHPCIHFHCLKGTKQLHVFSIVMVQLIAFNERWSSKTHCFCLSKVQIYNPDILADIFMIVLWYIQDPWYIQGVFTHIFNLTMQSESTDDLLALVPFCHFRCHSCWLVACCIVCQTPQGVNQWEGFHSLKVKNILTWVKHAG